MGGHCPGIGVGGDKRLLAQPHHIPEPSIRQMRDIHQNSQIVHLLHHLSSKGLQPPSHHRTIRGIRPSNGILMIPGQCHQPHTQIIKFLQPPQILSKGYRILQSQQAPHTSVSFAEIHILPAPNGFQPASCLDSPPVIRPDSASRRLIGPLFPQRPWHHSRHEEDCESLYQGIRLLQPAHIHTKRIFCQAAPAPPQPVGPAQTPQRIAVKIYHSYSLFLCPFQAAPPS